MALGWHSVNSSDEAWVADRVSTHTAFQERIIQYSHPDSPESWGHTRQETKRRTGWAGPTSIQQDYHLKRMIFKLCFSISY